MSSIASASNLRRRAANAPNVAGHPTLEPSEYKNDERVRRLRERLDGRDPLTHRSNSAHELNLLRESALLANAYGDDIPNIRIAELPWVQAQEWILFLCYRTQHTFFLQNDRVQDPIFFEAPSACSDQSPVRNVRPRKRPWEGAWENCLPWLKRFSGPHHLTVAELELALALFSWEAKEPAFTTWIRLRPHILRHVHWLLLNRYSYTLQKAFHKAAQKSGLDLPPFRAGEWTRYRPRIWGLNGLGILALFTFEPAIELFFTTSDSMKLGLTLVAGATALYFLVELDLFKQNHGLVQKRRHIFPRIVRTLISMLTPSVFGVLIVSWMIAFKTENLFLIQGSAVRFLGGAVLASLWATVIGVILQWLWEERSVLEPV